jgi:hypothetical protein
MKNTSGKKIQKIIPKINIYFSRIFNVVLYCNTVDFLAIFLIYSVFLSVKY